MNNISQTSVQSKPKFVIRPAERVQSKLRIGLSGPSGSGKTYSALLMASGLTSWEKIVVIDTENKSADLYSHLGPYSVLTLEAPFSPENYSAAIQACEDAGFEVIIIDSVTHEWDGKGGCLEINEKIATAKFKGNTWSAWSQTTPRHQAFIERITGCKCHVITTARSKTDTIQTEDKKIKKVGLKEIQREGYEYELTVNFNLDRDNNLAIASKDRTELFSNEDPFKITAQTGQILAKWNGEAPEKKVVEPEPVVEQEVDEEPVAPKPINKDQAKQITSLIKTKNLDVELIKDWMGKRFAKNSVKDLTSDEATTVIKSLEKMPAQNVSKPAAEPKVEQPAEDDGPSFADFAKDQLVNGGDGIDLDELDAGIEKNRSANAE